MKESNSAVKRILVVEDEPAIARVCLRVLVAEGFKVDVAGNGKIAQEMIAAKSYDLCFFDIRTPAMDGKELYHWLEEKHPRLVSRVIFTTGDVMGKDTESFLKQTGRPYLLKPFTTDELKATIKEALKRLED